MKNSIIYSLTFALLFFACRKDDNSKLPDLTRVPTPLILKNVTAADKVIPPLAPATFKGKFTVDLYFKSDVPPKKFDVVIVKNGNNAGFKIVQADVSTFPITVDITGQQLTTWFGSTPVSGDKFDIGVDITTQNGELFQAFPVTGVGYGAGVGNQIGASTSIRYVVPCPFSAAEYAGDFTVLSDEWEDYLPGEVIPVKVVSDHQISFEYKVTSGSKPIVLDVNLANNDITSLKQVYGKYGNTEYSAQAVPGDFSFADPCDVSLSVRLTHFNATGASVGNYTIRLKKK